MKGPGKSGALSHLPARTEKRVPPKGHPRDRNGRILKRSPPETAMRNLFEQESFDALDTWWNKRRY